MITPGVSRRSALQMVGALGAALIAAGVPNVLSATASCPGWVDAELLAGIRSMRQAYLSANAEDTEIERIWSFLVNDDRAALQQLIADDYAHPRIVRIGDWWLARTETRVYAAIAAHCQMS
jgi:hypothetical protein